MSFLFSKDSLIDFAAGWCSGAAAVLCCQPVDTILTRNQAGSQLVVDGIQTTRHLVTASPFKLWRGSAAMISAVPFQNALLMAGYGLGKRTDSNWGVFIGGCTGGVVQSFLMSPVELVKVNQQINVLGSARSTATAAVATKTATTAATLKPSAATIPTATATTTTTISSTRNLASHLFSPHAWRGLGATLLRDGIPHGIWFLSYEVGKQYLGSQSFAKDNENHKSFTVPLLSGAFAATTAWVSDCNFDCCVCCSWQGLSCFFVGSCCFVPIIIYSSNNIIICLLLSTSLLRLLSGIA